MIEKNRITNKELLEHVRKQQISEPKEPLIITNQEFELLLSLFYNSILYYHVLEINKIEEEELIGWITFFCGVSFKVDSSEYITRDDELKMKTNLALFLIGFFTWSDEVLVDNQASIRPQKMMLSAFRKDVAKNAGYKYGYIYGYLSRASRKSKR